MDDNEQLTSLKKILRGLVRRRNKLAERLAVEGIHADPSVSIQIEDLDKEIKQKKQEIASLQTPAEQQTRSRKSRTLEPRTPRNPTPVDAATNARLKNINRWLSMWGQHLARLKKESEQRRDTNDQQIVKHIQDHMEFLRHRKDTIISFCNLRGTKKGQQMYLYASDLLFRVCRFQKNIDLMSIIKDSFHDEIRDTLREARYYLEEAIHNRINKGIVYYKLAAIYYDLDDSRPEIIFEYCRHAINSRYDVDEVYDILLAVCRILSSYPNEYREEAQRLLIDQSQRLQREMSGSVVSLFCRG